MAVKAVEMVREIRYKNYKETKDLAIDEQIKRIKEISKKWQVENKNVQHR